VELALGVALPESALGGLAIATRRHWSGLPVGGEYDETSRRSGEKKTEQIADGCEELRCELKECWWNAIAAALAEKLVSEKWALVAWVVAERTAEMVDAAAKLIEIPLK
jgi:hypothetical protein